MYLQFFVTYMQFFVMYMHFFVVYVAFFCDFCCIFCVKIVTFFAKNVDFYAKTPFQSLVGEKRGLACRKMQFFDNFGDFFTKTRAKSQKWLVFCKKSHPEAIIQRMTWPLGGIDPGGVMTCPIGGGHPIPGSQLLSIYMYCTGFCHRGKCTPKKNTFFALFKQEKVVSKTGFLPKSLFTQC